MLRVLAEQKRALDELHYELWMCNSMLPKLLEMTALRQTNPEKTFSNEFQIDLNMCLESFLIHVRNLVYFLQDQSRDTDIRCSDFGIARVDVKLPDSNQLDAINKYLSHLTWTRAESHSPQWYFRDIRNEINDKFRAFFNKCENIPGLFPTVAGCDIASFRSLI